jgi:glycosyltransferase involved in cell wall biosynthesis
MRICIVGKYPPIQGGVSMRIYWNAHRFAAQGHEVHVVTNAKEARPPSLMHMRSVDWERCEATYAAGSVTVHWTDPVDRSQAYNPMAAPFISKLATTAARVHAERSLDVIFSHYMEPYGIAGHLAAEISGVPHVARMAGSDGGRLWRHPQFETLYDHVLRSAEIVVAAGAVADRAAQRGVSRDRIAIPGGFMVPEEVFTSNGPALDIVGLRAEMDQDPELRASMWGGFEPDRPYFGVCGKLGERKGSFALLAAMQQLKQAGLKIGLVVLAHGATDVEIRFRAMAQELGLTDCILQLPFLPHWRVPEFLRGCLAVCCLEQGFPIGFHTPIIPREVLLCGTCLVGSTEVLRKLPMHEQLPHGYGCVAIDDVNDVDTLSARLAAISANPELAAVVGARGCAFAQHRQRDALYPPTLEAVLEAASERRPAPSQARWRADESVGGAGSNLSGASLTSAGYDCPDKVAGQGAVASEVKRWLLAPEDRIELAIAATESDAGGASFIDDEDPLFRLRTKQWAMVKEDLERLVPIRNSRLRIVELDEHATQFLDAQVDSESFSAAGRSPSHIVAYVRSQRERRNPLRIDEATAQILKLSDGTRTALEIAKAVTAPSDTPATASNLEWIEHLFVLGLIGLQDAA